MGVVIHAHLALLLSCLEVPGDDVQLLYLGVQALHGPRDALLNLLLSQPLGERADLCRKFEGGRKAPFKGGRKAPLCSEAQVCEKLRCVR
jgi:hypothetical protein